MADPNALLMDNAEQVVTVKGMVFEKKWYESYCA